MVVNNSNADRPLHEGSGGVVVKDEVCGTEHSVDLDGFDQLLVVVVAEVQRGHADRVVHVLLRTTRVWPEHLSPRRAFQFATRFDSLPEPKLVLDYATPEGCKAELT